MRIMVVDDELKQVKSLERGLRLSGYETIGATSANEAFQHLDGDVLVDMVLTDYAMPEINGMEFAKEIAEKYSSLPVIMMTAYSEKKLVIEALRNRCVSFLEKPFTLEDLLSEIERVKINIIQNTATDQFSKLIPKILHQINNPLMSIMGSAQMAMLSLDDSVDIHNCLTNIVNNIEKIKDINNNIMKLDRGNNLKCETLDIRMLLEECLYMFYDLIGLKGIRFQMDLPDHALPVFGDWFSLEQAFKNLILNATDAMDGKTSKVLEIKAEKDKVHSEIVVAIKDNGCGISSASIDKIFNQYFTSKKTGTGLGLYISKGIIENHSGKVYVQSEEKKGTTFSVRLPIAEKAKSEQEISFKEKDSKI